MAGGARIEDRALLAGRGRFIDDLPTPPRTLHAAILRSPHAHARLGRIAAPSDVRLFAGAEIAAGLRPFIAALRTPMRHFPVATDKARYVGEPVAVVLAEDRYLAEDALERVTVEYEPLPAVVSPRAALAEDAPLLHEAMGGNLVSRRRFAYGDPESAFAAADRRIAIDIRYPRNAVTPIECFGLIAAWDPDDEAWDVTAPFQGPFALHPVMAAALGVPANRLRLRTPPDSGGSFGVKQGLAPYIVLMAAVARLSGRPVKWIEDRLEHLTAAGSATGRETRLEAALMADGRVTALRWSQLEDCGAYLKAPEPATLYRMHGALTGAYDIPNLEVENRIAVTNTTPSGLNRGFGGPQVYFALERLMHRIADRLGLDRLAVIRRNLVAKTPYRTASGAIYDSGDYGAVVELARPALEALRRRRAEARSQGRLYGVGLAAVVEPTVSNMGYITTVLEHEERLAGGPQERRARRRHGRHRPAWRRQRDGRLDAAGTGPPHRAGRDGRGGVRPRARGHPRGERVRQRPRRLVDRRRQLFLPLRPGGGGRGLAGGAHSARPAGAPHRRPAGACAGGGGLRRGPGRRGAGALASLRAAGGSRPLVAGLAAAGCRAGPARDRVLDPAGARPPDAEDRINGSAAYGFLFDVCGVEIDADTGQTRIDRYVSAHDAGRLLHRPDGGRADPRRPLQRRRRGAVRGLHT